MDAVLAAQAAIAAQQAQCVHCAAGRVVIEPSIMKSRITFFLSRSAPQVGDSPISLSLLEI